MHVDIKMVRVTVVRMHAYIYIYKYKYLYTGITVIRFNLTFEPNLL
jgi:hypothetical protein